MAESTVTLIDGLKLGETVYKKVVLREATAGDVIEAQQDSEKLVYVADDKGNPEPQFVSSPSLMGFHMLRRQIKSVDDYSGPLELSELKKLSTGDLNLLLDETEAMSIAATKALRAVVQRGRSGSSSETD